MLSLSQIEQDLTAAMKAKDQTAVDTLRGLKTRMQNEKIAKQKDLTDDDILMLIRSEVKRRKEAAEAYNQGSRAELAKKELAEAAVLEKYLPQQLTSDQLSVKIEEFLGQNTFSAKDFGAAMGKLKAQLGPAADGATLAKLLKEKLK